VIFKEDHDLFLACDGTSALELAQQHKIDVAVLDIRMAGMSGIEVLERLKILDPYIEVIMMTAFETPETMKQALRLRACDYINKPFDITTMRRAVATALERRSLSSELRHNAETLHQLQTEIQQQRMEEQIARNRGEIYASIIHDINSPLTIISGLLQFINQRIGNEPRIAGDELDMVRDRLKRITRQVTNCIEISRRYLGMLRQQQGEQTRVWVNQILGDLGELVRVHPNARNNQLLIHPLPEDVMVAIHGTDLIQVLSNLIINGLQCTSQSHRVEVSGHVLPRRLDLSHFRDTTDERFINAECFRNVEPLLALSVQDDGPGIPPEVLAKLFQPYFTTQANRKGSGLGLCIVQRLLKQASGSLQVHSKPGQGTVFTIYLAVTNTQPALPGMS
jgi:signal transduction histidine kinase